MVVIDAHIEAVQAATALTARAETTVATTSIAAAVSGTGKAESVTALAVAAVTIGATSTAKAPTLLVFVLVLLPGIRAFDKEATGSDGRSAKQEAKRVAPGCLFTQPVDDYRQSIERISVHASFLQILAASLLHTQTDAWEFSFRRTRGSTTSQT